MILTSDYGPFTVRAGSWAALNRAHFNTYAMAVEGVMKASSVELDEIAAAGSHLMKRKLDRIGRTDDEYRTFLLDQMGFALVMNDAKTVEYTPPAKRPRLCKQCLKPSTHAEGEFSLGLCYTCYERQI